MNIVIKDDKKEKYQSVEASIEVESGSHLMGYHSDFVLTGYGSNQKEAINNLIASLTLFKSELTKVEDIIYSL